jgi:hypothetical protein
LTLLAQNGVAVSNLAVDAGTVTFNVSWNNDMPENFLWSDSVWVFVDYNKAGVMTRLPLLSGATLIAASPGGRVMEESGNNKGVWVVGNARTEGSFSATVKLLTAAATATVPGACAYASNYPPVGNYVTTSRLTFSGTPMYELVLKHLENETDTIFRTSGATFGLPCDYTLTSFTDATGAPGTFHCTIPAAQMLLASDMGYCVGLEGVQLALGGTEAGVTYQLYKDGLPLVTIQGEGGAATFSGYFGEGKYRVETADDVLYCQVAITGQLTIMEYLLPDAPIMDGGGAQCGGMRSITATPVTDGANILWKDDYYGPAREVDSGTYYAVSVTSEGCTSAESLVVVQIYDIPVMPELTVSSSTVAGTSATFTATGGSGSYVWSGDFSGEGSVKYSPTAGGDYSAAVSSFVHYETLTCFSDTTEVVWGTVIPKLPESSACTNTDECDTGLRCCKGRCWPTNYSCTNTHLYYAVDRGVACPSGWTTHTNCSGVPGDIYFVYYTGYDYSSG